MDAKIIQVYDTVSLDLIGKLLCPPSFIVRNKLHRYPENVPAYFLISVCQYAKSHKIHTQTIFKFLGEIFITKAINCLCLYVPAKNLKDFWHFSSQNDTPYFLMTIDRARNFYFPVFFSLYCDKFSKVWRELCKVGIQPKYADILSNHIFTRSSI